MTKTEEFANRCCANFNSVGPDVVADKVKAGAVGWVVWVELVINVIQSIIADCPQKNRIAEAASKGPSRWQRIRVRRMTFKTAECCGYDMYRRDAGAIADCVMDTAADEPENVLEDIVQEVSDPDNWLF